MLRIGRMVQWKATFRIFNGSFYKRYLLELKYKRSYVLSAVSLDNDFSKNALKFNELATVDTKDEIKLRSYQQECIDTIVETLKSKKTNKIAVSVATGGGKTVIFCKAIPHILDIERYDGDVANGILIAVHRRELASQTVNTLKRLGVVDDDRIFLEMGKSKVDVGKTFSDLRPFVIVASVPTLFRKDSRLYNYDTSRFKALIIDECHHGVSDGYKFICQSLNCLKMKSSENKERSKEPFLLGFSATMARADRVPLKQIFDEIVFNKGIASLIEENHLCDFEWNSVSLGLNLEDVELKGDDFRLDSLAKHVNTLEINTIALKTYLKLKNDHPNNFKSLLVFCVNVQHMKDLSELFRYNGINAQYVSGETKSSERDKIVRDFKDGKIQVLFNCGVFTEGTDIPNIDSIFLLRPTKSKPLLVQMVGRGLRLHDGKEKLLVTDFVDNKSLGLTITSTLKGKADILNLLTSTGGGNGPSRNDDLLPGDIEYIKFTNYKALDLLEKKPEANDAHVQLMKIMKLANKIDYTNPWVQVKYNAWAKAAGYSSYFKVESEKDGTYKATFTFTRRTFDDKYRAITNEIVKTTNTDSILKLIDEYILDHQSISDSMDEYCAKQAAMRVQKITPAQHKFIEKVLYAMVIKNKSDALDIEKLKEVTDVMFSKISRLDASQLIFAYSVSKSQSLMIWFKQNFLNSKKNRERITKNSILDEIKSNAEGGWI
ncbi:hypothetical protein CANINC_002432 [Pichia inconspicua]|uniref:ATP-dependent helicase IRC3 n=1 Tax=Pichia inconspicua TaxID=52247 RepID=A0A4T0X1N4_9ASCO|nr:hypothetical protein CANINC_002432 [[Candida] inconspicua]